MVQRNKKLQPLITVPSLKLKNVIAGIRKLP